MIWTTIAAVLLVAPAPVATADPPRFPGPPVVTEVSATSAVLRWEPPNTDPAPTYYDIYTIENGQERTFNGSYETSLLVAGLRPNRSYTFVIGVRPGLRSPAVTFSTPSLPVEANAPAAPGTPEVTMLESSRAGLSFAASADDSGVAEYLIYESRPGGATLFGATSVWPGHPGTTWTGGRMLPDYEYELFVVAVDYFGNRSQPSAPVTLRTTPHPGSSCRAEARLVSASGGRYSATVTVVNTGVFLDVHTIRATLPAGQRNDPVRSWEFTQDGDELLYAYAGWAGGFGQGATKQFRLVVEYADAPVLPDGWRLNGQPCGPL